MELIKKHDGTPHDILAAMGGISGVVYNITAALSGLSGVHIGFHRKLYIKVHITYKIIKYFKTVLGMYIH